MLFNSQLLFILFIIQLMIKSSISFQSYTPKKTFKLIVVIDPANNETFSDLEFMVRVVKTKVFQQSLISPELDHGVVVIVNTVRARNIAPKIRIGKNRSLDDAVFNEYIVNERCRSLKRQNPLSVTRTKICNNILNDSVAVILVHPPSPTRLSKWKDMVSAISYALGFYKVPVISIASRESEFSDKTIYPTFLRTTEPFSKQADIWIRILQKLEYRKVILIFTEDDNANALINRFREQADKLKIEIQRIISLETGLLSYYDLILKGLDETTSNIYLLHANEKDSEVIFRDAAWLNMTDRSKVWIVSEPCMQTRNVPQGVLGAKLDLTPRRSLLEAFQVFRRGFVKLYKHYMYEIKPIEPPHFCTWKSPQRKNWTTTKGNELYGYMKSYFKGNDDNTALGFDDQGDRIGLSYFIINIQHNTTSITDQLEHVVVGQYHTDQAHNNRKMSLDLNVSMVRWPGDSKTKPSEITLPSHLRVITVEDAPFVYRTLPLDNSTTCAEIEVFFQVIQPDAYALFGTKFLPSPGSNGGNIHATLLNKLRRFANPKTQKLLQKTFDNLNRKKKPEEQVLLNQVLQEVAKGMNEDQKKLFIKEVEQFQTALGKNLLEQNPPVDGVSIRGPWFPCSYANETKPTKDVYCCSGFAVDLLSRLAQNLSDKVPTKQITFDISLINSYGSPTKNPDTGEVTWSGMIGMLIKDEADIGIGALSINADREEVVDFTNPWHYHGITIMETKKPRYSPMQSFMQPFTWILWVTLMGSVIVVGVILFVLDKKSPFQKFYGQPDPVQGSLESEYWDPGAYDEDQPLSFSGAMWFVWGVLLDSGIGEKTPRCFSARVVGMVWCGFSMIMVASYTANLAAFLVLDQPIKSLSGITDTRLRNPSANFTFATVKDSNVNMYFQKHVEYSTMYRKMEGRNYEKAIDAVRALKKGKLDAFIWDSTRLEFEAAKDCQLVTSASKFGGSAYGIGLQKDSPWTELFTLAILQLGENGQMEDLDGKWISRVKPELSCPQSDDAPVRLGLTNMKDVFILVAIGILFGLGLSFVEVRYKRRKMRERHQQRAAEFCGKEWRSQTLVHSAMRQASQSSSPENQALLNRRHPTLKEIVADKKLKKLNEAANQINSSPERPMEVVGNDSQRKASDEFGFGALKSGMPITRAIRDGQYSRNSIETDKEVELTFRKPVARV